MVEITKKQAWQYSTNLIKASDGSTISVAMQKLIGLEISGIITTDQIKKELEMIYSNKISYM